MEEDQILVMMMGMEVDLPLPHQKALYQQEDGRDGQTPQITKALEDALKTQKTSWDTTNLENSFDYFGRTMHEVLKAQQKTTQNLEEQFKRASETQEFQTEAMQYMANANF